MSKKIGLVLSGGGIRGIAHLGVLQYLEELGIRPSFISGTSSGALIGAFYSAGYRAAEILTIAKAEKFFSFSGLQIKNVGLFNPEIFEIIIKKYIPDDQIESLLIPLSISVTDLTNAKLLIFNKGSLSLAVKASCCVPVVFQPVILKGAYLFDGGILNDFPIEPLENVCEKIIGVFVNSLVINEHKMGYIEIMERTLQIALHNNVRKQKERCDVYIEPPEMSRFKIFDFNKMDEIYQFGYAYAQNYTTELLKLATGV